MPDPHQLDISLSINGETLQSSNTRELIFKVPRLISYISTMMPLVPGDIISTGTPAGVGMGRTPQRWLRPGDDVVVKISGIGSLRNPVLAEPWRYGLFNLLVLAFRPERLYGQGDHGGTGVRQPGSGVCSSPGQPAELEAHR